MSSNKIPSIQRNISLISANDYDGDGDDDNTAGNEDYGDRFESSQLIKPNQTGTYIVPNLYSNNVKNNEISD